MPSSLLTKLLVLNSSKSSMCSPVPTNIMGDLVAATALSAPPPLACPSSLVMMTLPTFTASRNALAWSLAACPMELSIQNTTSSGDTTRATSCISSNSADSCLCRPLVSTMISSYFSALNCFTPSSATTTGSRSVYEP